MVEIASQILICMLIATFIGFIMGYIIGKSQVPTVPKAINKDTKLSQQTETTDVEIKEDILKEEESTPSQEQEVSQTEELEAETEKPELLSEPREGEKDDLTKIKGVGLKLEKKLNDAGIYHFEQIANWTEKNIKWIEKHTPLNSRIKKTPWIEQAKKYL